MAGVMDVIVIERPDGSLASTPFYVELDVKKVTYENDRIVDIFVNNTKTCLTMRLTDNKIGEFSRGETSQAFIRHSKSYVNLKRLDYNEESKKTIIKYTEDNIELINTEESPDESSINLSSDELKLLNLQKGANQAQFVLRSNNSKYVNGKIFL